MFDRDMQVLMLARSDRSSLPLPVISINRGGIWYFRMSRNPGLFIMLVDPELEECLPSSVICHCLAVDI